MINRGALAKIQQQLTFIDVKAFVYSKTIVQLNWVVFAFIEYSLIL